MSFHILPQSGGLGTQLGAGLGKGLAESLPEGIKQGRLSATLKNLEGQNLSPLEQISKLAGLGGASFQEASQALPLIQQSQQRQRYLGNDQTQPQPNGIQNESGQEQPTEITSKQNLARKLWGNDRLRFKTIDEAEDYAGRRIDDATKEYDRVKENFLQKPANEQYKDIVGELDEEYRNKLKNSINGRGDETAEANRAAKKMLDFAKVRGDLRTNLDKNYLTLPHQQMMNALNKQRADYAKNGQLHNFANDLIAGGMSGNYARTFAQPVDNDPGMRSILNAIPKQKSISFIESGKSNASEIKQQHQRVGAEKVFENIMSKINPNVSLSSIGLELMSKGYNPDDWISYANQHQERLGKYQIEELGKTDRWNPNLDDIFILEGKKGAPAWWRRVSTALKG